MTDAEGASAAATPRASEQRWVRPPALLVALAAIVAGLGIAMTAVGSQQTGVSTDEPGHVRRLNSYIAFGLYTRPFERNDTAAGDIPLGAYVYGPATSLLQHRVNVMLGHEPEWEAQTTAQDYATRHAVIAALSIAGLLATAALAWLLLPGWRWGVLAAGTLAAIPLWTGHGMFNPKDVPVAAAHTLVTATLVALALSKPATRWWTVAAAAVPLTAGTVLMLGTRPSMWPSLFGLLVVLGIILARARRELTRSHLLRVSGVVLGSLAASYGLLQAMYPRVYRDLFEALLISVTTGAHYDGLGDHAPSDRMYLPTHLFTDLPLGLLTLMGAGTVFTIIVAFSRRRSTRIDCLALVAAQAFALMGAAVLLDSNVYQGLRQMLFAIPALAVFAVVGLAVLLTRAPAGLARRAVAIAAGLALVLPTAVQLSLFPYQYSYVNAVAEQAGAVSVDGYDYFATSFREYADQEPQDVKVVCPFLRFGGDIKRDDPDCRVRFAHTFSAYWRDRPTPDEPDDDEFYALLRSSRPTPPNCTIVREVTRRGNVSTIVMSRLFRCHPPTDAEKDAGDRIVATERRKQGWVRVHRPDGQDGPAIWVPAGS